MGNATQRALARACRPGGPVKEAVHEAIAGAVVTVGEAVMHLRSRRLSAPAFCLLVLAGIAGEIGMGWRK
jgi:hypothetical protein